MRLKNILIVVKDMERSKRFYKEVFGLDVLMDNGANVMLTQGLVLQEASVWEQLTKLKIQPYNNTTEIFFVEQDIERFAGILEQYDARCQEEAKASGMTYCPIQYVNKLQNNGLGRRIIRFYDPDGNLLEVGASV